MPCVKRKPARTKIEINARPHMYISVGDIRRVRFVKIDIHVNEFPINPIMHTHERRYPSIKRLKMTKFSVSLSVDIVVVVVVVVFTNAMFRIRINVLAG